jgi:hypothetical protein
MKQYVVDELRPEDQAKIKGFLDQQYAVPGFEGLYWIPIDEALLDGVQKAHDDCRPFYFALELLPDRLACELLVRTKQQIRCECVRYATQNQRNWLIALVDAALAELNISV